MESGWGAGILVGQLGKLRAGCFPAQLTGCQPAAGCQPAPQWFGASAVRQTGPISCGGVRVVAGVREFFLKNALPTSVIGARAASAAAGAAWDLVRAEDGFWIYDGLGPMTRDPHWLP